MGPKRICMKSITKIVVVWILIILILGGCAIQQPLKTPVSEKETAETCLNRAIAYSQEGEYSKALSDYNKAIAIDPNLTVAYLNRGVTYRQLGEYDKAISDYSKAIELFPRYALAYNNRGYAYGKKGEVAKAIFDYSKAIEIDPKYAAAYYNRGLTYYHKGENDRAWEDINKAQSLGYPVSPGFLKTLRETSSEQK